MRFSTKSYGAMRLAVAVPVSSMVFVPVRSKNFVTFDPVYEFPSDATVSVSVSLKYPATTPSLKLTAAEFVTEAHPDRSRTIHGYCFVP